MGVREDRMRDLPERPVSEREALFHRAGVQRLSAQVGMPSPRNIWQTAVHAYKAYELYLMDRLPDAVEATRIALRHAHAGDGLPNLLYIASAELEARDHAQIVERPPFTFELPAGSPNTAGIVALTDKHAQRLERMLQFERVPTMFTVLAADSLVELSNSPHGYLAPKEPFYKVCVVDDPEAPPDDLSRALTHEYMHVITGELTGDRSPRWVLEGVAEWAELEVSDEGELDQLELMPGEVPKLNEIEGIFWSGMSVAEEPMQYAYAGAYSAVEFLIERHGMFDVREFMVLLATQPEGKAFKRAFDESRGSFERAWRRMLKERPREE